MGKVFINEETLVAISDAIRAKTGGTGLIKPGDWAGELDNVKGSGQYLWSKKGMSETVVEDTGTSYTLTTANTTRPSSEIEYSASAPVYEDGTWKMKNSTVVTLVNTDTVVPSATNVYVRLTSAPNVWYYVSKFTAGALNTSGTCTKSMAYSKSYTAEAGSDVLGYAVGDEGTEYPDDAWLDGYYWELVGGMAEIINFTIVHGYYDDIPLKAEKGMTWQEFVNSDYSSNVYINEDASEGEYTFSLSNNYVTVYDGDEKYYITRDYSARVLPNDPIIENGEYYCIAGAQ